MGINLVIVLIFFVLLLFMALLYRNSTLDKLVLMQDEQILFEESGLRVKQSGSPRDVIYINCIVRVTGSRIIVAQKMLFRKQYALRFVITYNGLVNDADIMDTMKKGYIAMRVNTAAVQLAAEGGGGMVRINIPETALTRGQYITYATKRYDDYSRIFR